MQKKIFRSLFPATLFLLILIMSACANSNDTPENTTMPGNLTVDVGFVGQSDSLPHGDGSGSVNFTVHADNATYYKIETDCQTMNIDNAEGGTVNYVYSSVPDKITSYNITVTALDDNFNSIDTTFQIDVYYQLKLIWYDDFEGNSLNPDYWSVETDIHVNNELQVYSESGNYDINDGVLTITCKKVNNNQEYGSYTSARLNTYGKVSFHYGRIEARLKLPKGTGTWPAFWMLGNSIGTGTNWPACGEIDIMEYVGYTPYWVQSSMHSQSNYGSTTRNGRYQLSSANDEGEWHTYGLVWSAKKLAYYVDDYTDPFYTCYAPNEKTDDDWPFDNQYFIILNLAFGGDWGGAGGIDTTLNNMKYQVDWVKYYGEE
jgi:beta-glucanase (GH16 family)